jgi:hypothetical protein
MHARAAAAAARAARHDAPAREGLTCNCAGEARDLIAQVTPAAVLPPAIGFAAPGFVALPRLSLDETPLGLAAPPPHPHPGPDPSRRPAGWRFPPPGIRWSIVIVGLVTRLARGPARSRATRIARSSRDPDGVHASLVHLIGHSRRRHRGASVGDRGGAAAGCRAGHARRRRPW